MGLEERRARWEAMMAVLRGNTIAHWGESFLAALGDSGSPIAARAEESRGPASLDGRMARLA